MFKKLVQKVNNLGTKMVMKVGQFTKDQRGELSSMTWIIGSAVVVVLVVVVLMTLAPDTAETMWEAFVRYARSAFGI